MIYTQDADSYIFQKHAEEQLKKVFKNKIPVTVTYRSNDSILYQLYQDKHLTIEEVVDLRKDTRIVIMYEREQIRPLLWKQDSEIMKNL